MHKHIAAKSIDKVAQATLNRHIISKEPLKIQIKQLTRQLQEKDIKLIEKDIEWREKIYQLRKRHLVTTTIYALVSLITTSIAFISSMDNPPEKTKLMGSNDNRNQKG